MQAAIGEVVHYLQPGSDDQDFTCLPAVVVTPKTKSADLWVLSTGKMDFKRGVIGDIGSEGADTWHPANQCPYDR